MAKLEMENIPFGKVFFFSSPKNYFASGNVYSLALAKTVTETLPEGIQMAIFAHFQMEIFYNFKFCHNRINDFRVHKHLCRFKKLFGADFSKLLSLA